MNKNNIQKVLGKHTLSIISILELLDIFRNRTQNASYAKVDLIAITHIYLSIKMYLSMLFFKKEICLKSKGRDRVVVP